MLTAKSIVKLSFANLIFFNGYGMLAIYVNQEVYIMHLQESGEMYLETIYVLSRTSNTVRSIDVGEYM